MSIVGPLKERKFKGVLVYTYVAGEMKEFSSEELRVNKIIDHNSYYGVVFGEGRLSERPFRTASRTENFEIVKANTKPMEVSFFGNLLNQGHPTTVFCKISVRRRKDCLEFSIA